MVATPGDPRNGIPIDELDGDVRIDAAYGGSCTGGKMADMDMYAAVLQNALANGKRVAEGVHLYIQFGSQKIKQYARQRGYIDILRKQSRSARKIETFPAAAAPANSTSPHPT
jgi:3-isopropylmalate/(R)-2-methylmalate dehydratase large subunit